MGRRFKSHETERRAKQKREYALERPEFRGESAPRAPASGPISAAVKVNPDAGLIAAFLRDKRDR